MLNRYIMITTAIYIVNFMRTIKIHVVPGDSAKNAGRSPALQDRWADKNLAIPKARTRSVPKICNRKQKFV